MSIDTLRPNASVANAWTTNGTFPANLAEVVTQPTAPATGSGFIQSTTAGQVAQAELSTFTLPAGETVAEVDVWIYGNAGAKRSFNAELLTGTTVLATATNLIPAGSGNGWYTFSFVGSLTQTEIDALRVRLTTTSTAGGGGAGFVNVFAVYVEVDHQPATANVNASDSASLSDAATLQMQEAIGPATDIAVLVEAAGILQPTAATDTSALSEETSTVAPSLSTRTDQAAADDNAAVTVSIEVGHRIT